MKKIIFVLTLFVGLLFSSCNQCSTNEVPIVTAVKDSTVTLIVENTISTDREAMYLKAGDDYRWYETCITLPEFIDDENVTSNPVTVVNVFQKIVERKNGYDTWVYKFKHFNSGLCLVDSIQGFWIEDWALNEEEIGLKYIEAYERMMESNYPKPHSKQVCLRNPIGPIACNTQYVFGNIREQLWVDAVTGDVVDFCPAFLTDDEGFTMPLGEWP